MSNGRPTGSSNQPALKVAVKPRGEGSGGRVSICAAWRDEATGKLRASFDKRVVRIVMLMDDGAKVDIRKGDDGKWDHFVDIFENDAPRAATAGRPAPRAAAASADDLLGDGPAPSGGYSGGADPGDDFGGDDIPFDAAPSAGADGARPSLAAERESLRSAMR